MNSLQKNKHKLSLLVQNVAGKEALLLSNLNYSLKLLNKNLTEAMFQPIVSGKKLPMLTAK